MINRFLRRDDGNVAVAFAMSLLPIAGLAGAAIDYGRAQTEQARRQAALDAAVLVGARDGSEAWAGKATGAYNAVYGPNAPTPTFARGDGGSYVGTASTAVPTTLTSVIGVSEITTSARASATVDQAAWADACILTLGAGVASEVSLRMNGAPRLDLSGCAIRSNTSMTCNGHDGDPALAIAAGTVNKCGNARSGASAAVDAYDALKANITTSCTGKPGATWTAGANPPASVTRTARDGYDEYRVCGTLTLSGSGRLVSGRDAVIVIENGSLVMDDRAVVDASRVAFVLTGDGASPSVVEFPKGNGKAATLTLSPPSGAANPWRGISIYQDPKLVTAVDSTWGPGTTINVDGVIYLPKADLELHGNSGSPEPSCAKIVAKTMTLSGAVRLKQTQQSCESMGVSAPAARTVRLSA